MGGWKNCCEINTVSSTCGFLQVLPWNNNTVIEKKMAGNDVVMKQTFNISMPETKEVLQL